jgi:hypothetical protein
MGPYHFELPAQRAGDLRGNADAVHGIGGGIRQSGNKHNGRDLPAPCGEAHDQ